MSKEHPGVIKKAATGTRTGKARSDNTPAAAKATTNPASETKTHGEESITDTPSTAERAQQTRKALAERQAELTEATARHERDRTAVEDLSAFLSSGQAIFSDLDTYVGRWQSTHAAESVTALVVEGCKANVTRAEAALINDETAVADLLADVLTEVYTGQLPVRVVTVPEDVSPDDNGGPVLFILQQRASTNNAGILSANLMLTYYRPPLFAPLDVERIVEVCRARDFAVDLSPWGSNDHGTFHEDPIAVRVRRAFLSVPVLTHAPDEGTVSLYVNAVRNRLRNSLTYYGERAEVRMMGDPAEGRAEVNTVSHAVLERAENNGDHRITLEAVYSVKPDKLLSGNPVALMREAINAEVGRMADEMGRVIDVKHPHVTIPEVRRHVEREPYVLTAHITVTYRLD